MIRIPTIWIALFILSSSVAAIQSAHADEPTIVILNIAGDKRGKIRGDVAAALDVKYNVIGSSELLAGCEELGIEMSRGTNLARCAGQVGAVAVIGGKYSAQTLSIVVYSGESGEPIGAGIVRWPKGKTKRAKLREVLLLIVEALKKAPDSPRERESVGPKSPDIQLDDNEGTQQQEGEIRFEPDDESPPNMQQKPKHRTPQQAEPKDDDHDDEEDPDESSGAKRSLPFDPRVHATIGLGTWLRGFSLNDPASQAPKYESGATFSFRFHAEVRPLSFFLENFLADIYLSLDFQMAAVIPIPAGSGITATAMRELLFDVGYQWTILDRDDSPRFKFGVGFGMFDFALKWDSETQPTVPGVGYRFALFGLGFDYPFLPFMGAHLRFNYRFVFSAGDIVNRDVWYGPASVGGLAGSIGLNGNWRNIIATLEYGYTRYFFSFTEAQQQQDSGRKAAGGALDQSHVMMVSGGYSF